jgi:histone-lysine N-methyltransferase SETD2
MPELIFYEETSSDAFCVCSDTFLMEYVGEVLDPRQFRKRARKYASDDVQHFYFMALSSEYFIDASSKGNISRFINHSCDPNAETQKVFIFKLYINFYFTRMHTHN